METDNILTENLPYIDEVPPFTADDEDCLKAIGQVLKQHGKLHRFGVNLLHSHFPLQEGETLLETCNPVTRTLTIKPVSLSELSDQQIRPTNWTLGEEGSQIVMGCKSWCTIGLDKEHTAYHVEVV